MKKTKTDAGSGRLPFFRCFKKNMKNIYRLCPSSFPYAILFLLMQRAIPFVTMFLGAEIVDMLVKREEEKKILILAAVMVGSQMLMELLRCGAAELVHIRFQLVSHRKNREIGVKAMGMDYEILERNSTQELIAQADSNTDKQGGMFEYVMRSLDLIGAVFSCIGAGAAMFGLFVAAPYHGEGAVYGFFASPVSYFLLLGMLIFSIYVSSKCEARQGRIRYSCDQIEVRNGRIYWFFLI